MPLVAIQKELLALRKSYFFASEAAVDQCLSSLELVNDHFFILLEPFMSVVRPNGDSFILLYIVLLHIHMHIWHILRFCLDFRVMVWLRLVIEKTSAYLFVKSGQCIWVLFPSCAFKVLGL